MWTEKDGNAYRDIAASVLSFSRGRHEALKGEGRT